MTSVQSSEQVPSTRPVGYAIRPGSARLTTLLVALVVAALVGAGAAAGQPASPPTYSTLLQDCVTGNNQFWSSSDDNFHWWVNQAVGSDASSGSIKCDSHQNDQYERPTEQTFQSNAITAKPVPDITPPPQYQYVLPVGEDAPKSPVFLSGLDPDPEFNSPSSVFSTEGLYFEFIDITRGQAGFADVDATTGWLFFQIELFGEREVTSDLERVSQFGTSTFYTVRLGARTAAPESGEGIALRNQRLTANTVSAAWTTSNALIFRDADTSPLSDRVGHTAINVPKPTDAPGNGYEATVTNNAYLYLRRVDNTFTGSATGGTAARPAVEFAFNYKKYNAEQAGPDFTPQNLTYVELDSTRGQTDPQNYLWNDEFNLSEAGSPNSGEASPNNGPQNLVRLDTLRMGGFPQEASLTVVKDTVPDGDGAQFDFATTGQSAYKLDTDGDDGDGARKQESFTYTAFGDKVIHESALPAGWTLTGIVCSGTGITAAEVDFSTDGSSWHDDFQAGDDFARVDLQAGDAATCTFTNTNEASLTVVKDTVPDGDGAQFDFATTGQSAYKLDTEGRKSTRLNSSHSQT